MSWIFILVLLICPLMMLFMHGGHKGDKHSGGKHDHNHSHHHGDGDNSRHSSLQDNYASSAYRKDSYKVKQLEAEVNSLKEQNELLQKKVEGFSHGVTH